MMDKPLLLIAGLLLIVPLGSFAARKTGTVALAASPAGSGIVSGAGTFFVNTSVYISAVPATGYSFVSWSDGSTSQGRSVVVRGDKTYTANFVAVAPATVYAVSLAWDPVTNLHAGYRIYWGGRSRSYTNSQLTTMTTMKIDGLPSGTYYFSAIYFTASGEQSEYSQEAMTKTP